MTVVDFSDHQDEPTRHHAIAVAWHIVTPVALGVVMTTALFYLMQSLIGSQGAQVAHRQDVQLVDFVRVPKLSAVQTRDLHPKKPPPPEKMPPVKTSMNFRVSVDNQQWSMQPVKLNHESNLAGTWTFSSDGNYLPIVKVAPIYPTTAEMNGLEGWVVLQFTIDELGRVIDPEVVDDCAQIAVPGKQNGENCADQPNRVFDQAALNAALKFKYKPKMVDGSPVVTPHVRHKFVFVLGD